MGQRSGSRSRSKSNLRRAAVDITGFARPEQIFLHTVSPRTCLKESGQVQRYNEQVPLSRGN